MSREAKALEKILEAIADIRVDVQLAGYLLSGEDEGAKERLYALVETARSFDILASNDLYEENENLESEEVSEEELSEEWFENVPLLEAGRLSDSQLTQMLISFIEDPTLFDYTDGELEALGRRIGFKFSDGTVIWHGAGEGIILSHLTKELKESDWKEYKYLISYGTPTFLSYANGWTLAPNPEWRTLVDIVEILEQRLEEKATVFIPMQYFAERSVEDGLEEYLSQAGVEDEDESIDIYTAAFNLLSKMNEKSLPFRREVSYVDGDSYLPEYSAYGRFERFLELLESEHGWGIVRDECCGTCSGGSARDIRSQPGFENAPIFFTWSQNSFAYWGTSGWVAHQHYTDNEEEIKTLISVANSVGLDVGIEDSHYGVDGVKVLSFS
jgi:hypothetical protein